MANKGKPNRKKLKYFVFRGFIRCGECGCLITAETQKGHNYYHCTKRKTKCFQKYVREESLAEQISEYIQKVFLPDDWARNIITEIKKEKSENAQSSNFFAQNINEKISMIDEKLERLMAAYLENAILLEEYQQNKNKLVEEKQVLKDKLSSFEQKRNNWFEPAIRFVKSAKYAGILAKSNNFEEKRDFFKKLGSNFKILNQKIVFDLENPFKILANAEPRRRRGEAENSSCINWRRGWDSNPR